MKVVDGPIRKIPVFYSRYPRDPFIGNQSNFGGNGRWEFQQCSFPKGHPKVKRKGYFGEKSLVIWDAILISRCGHPGLARAMARPHVHTCDLCVRAAVDA